MGVCVWRGEVWVCVCVWRGEVVCVCVWRGEVVCVCVEGLSYVTVIHSVQLRQRQCMVERG